jgi:site-specific recombinase XerD
MSNIVKDLNSIEIETLDNIRSSKSKNTVRAYKSDFNHFIEFCKKNNLKFLPTEPKIVSFYLTHLSGISKVSTLKRRLASISVIHKIKGHYIDIKHPLIIENLMGIQRKKGVFQKSKHPILLNELREIINVIEKNNNINDLKKKRDKALILIGFSGGFRRSELVNIDLNDVEFTKEGVKVFIKRSKTDQSGEGMTKAIPYFKEKSFCAVIFLKEWIRISNIQEGLIFNISDKMVALLIKRYLTEAGFDSKKYSGHSLRSGFATVAADSGADEKSIMNMTGHKTTQMVRRYIKEANLFKNNPLNKINF